MINESPPELPQRSLTSQGVLYRPLQDIEVFVEDEGSEVFYEELLYRLLDKKHHIVKVFPLRGRENVIAECQIYNEEHPALFIIDGDLSWVAGEPDLCLDRIFVHQCYCIENYLICENAAVGIAFENSGILSRTDIKTKLNWPDARKAVEAPLVELFCEFAVAHVLEPTLKTTSYGFESICIQKKKHCLPQLDSYKAALLADKVRTAVIATSGDIKYKATRERIKNRITSLTDPLDVVSGKNFLIPLLLFCIKQVANINLTRDSFILRLAKNCSLEKLDILKRALVYEITRYHTETQQTVADGQSAAP